MFPLPADDRSVSPVIGIILMVAITVILASVIGTFAFGLFDRDTNPAPSVVFESEYDGSDELTITHESGDEFDSANVEFKIEDGGTPPEETPWPTEVNTGDSVTLENVGPDDTVLVVWQDPRKGDQTQILREWSGPDA